MATHGVVAIVGPGLIGGSIGLCLKQRGLAKRVIGVARSAASADRALAAGVVDEATTDVPYGVALADLVVVCTPVSEVVAACRQAAEACPAGAVITDCGSTKGRLVGELASLPADGPAFVGSHPLAGDHKSGPESARADLLVDRVVVVTPNHRTDAGALKRVTHFWESLGARVAQMSPQMHDIILAHTSHAPHVIASALAAATPEKMLPLTGGGWRDTTRIAAASPGLWTDILLHNSDATLQAIEAYIEQLRKLQNAIADHDRDAILRHLEEGKLRRDALGS